MIRTKTPKPNRCKHCKVRMPEDMARHVLHPECIDPWIAIQREKQEKARIKSAKVRAAKDKRETRARIIETKGRGYWTAQAQTAFNLWVRTRDAGQPCICCGKPFELQKPGGSMDAGHYLSRGAAPHLRFDERNVFGQRKNCNRPGGATRSAFRAGVIARIGLEAVEALEADQEPRKWSIDDLKQIKATYTAKARELQKERA